MNQLPVTDIVVLIVYMGAVFGLGCWFVRKNKDTSHFMAAGGSIPGWAVGLSIFGTYLSSNTFLGVPGKAFGTNWNAYVFSLSLPIAALIAVKYFVPFYRKSGEISAYTHFEKKYGRWARTYAVVCYLLTQLSRMGAILFGVALGLQALTGWDMASIILITGVLVTVYTLLGGIEAVIWTDVIQSIVLMVGAVVIVVMLAMKMPEGVGQIVDIGMANEKFSLGSFGADLTTSTFWVVLFFGMFINLNNFGIDQSFVQRYHTAKSDKEARRSVWLGALLYVPISLVFFVIGAELFAYYSVNEEMMEPVKMQVAEQKMGEMDYQPGLLGTMRTEAALVDGMKHEDYADKVLPYFIVNELPTGFGGLIIAAIFAAAMSSVDTSLNSSATVTLKDLYATYVNPEPSEADSMRVLRWSTIGWGVLGTGVALIMIGQKSLLDAWWTLSGIFAGGMLGLFLLGMVVKRAGRIAGIVGVLVGVSVISWMTFSPGLEAGHVARSPFHSNLIVVFGTTTIVLVGFLVTTLQAGKQDETPE